MWFITLKKRFAGFAFNRQDGVRGGPIAVLTHIFGDMEGMWDDNQTVLG